MHKLIKTLNKFNGNICFIGVTDFSDYVFECDRQNRLLSYVSSTKPVTDVCLMTSNSYSVAFSDQYVGKYSSGVLDDTFIDTVAISNVDKITIDTQSNYYILNRVTNQLFKYNGGVIWTFDLPDYSLRYEGNIAFRESDGNIIYNNDTNLYVIRDDTTKATLLNTLALSGAGSLSVVIGNEFKPTYSYFRARTVSGGDLDQSSSSSESSTSSSTSSSSSTEIRSSSSSSSTSSSSSSSTENMSSSSSSSEQEWDLSVLLPPAFPTPYTIGDWATIVNNTGNIADLVAVTSCGADDQLFAAKGDFTGSQALANCSLYDTGIGFPRASKCAGSNVRPPGWVLVSNVAPGQTVTLGLWEGLGGGISCSGRIAFR